MRRMLFALAGFLALGAGAASVQPAQAQPYPYYGPGPYARPLPYRARPWGPPIYRPFYRGPRCWITQQRVWGPFGWAWRPVRVCR